MKNVKVNLDMSKAIKTCFDECDGYIVILGRIFCKLLILNLILASYTGFILIGIYSVKNMFN